MNQKYKYTGRKISVGFSDSFEIEGIEHKIEHSTSGEILTVAKLDGSVQHITGVYEFKSEPIPETSEDKVVRLAKEIDGLKEANNKLKKLARERNDALKTIRELSNDRHLPVFGKGQIIKTIGNLADSAYSSYNGFWE